ncbi:MAG TPA: hypothetical protein VF658_15845 [Pyrinomonadaceae bacterium]|jgi:hypothetical protein
MLKQAIIDAELPAISEAEFVKLCNDIYADRYQIYKFNPNASRREALLWMLLGCLISLLSLSDSDQQSVYEPSSLDPYARAICEILQNRMRPPFDPRAHLAELSKKIETDAE